MVQTRLLHLCTHVHVLRERDVMASGTEFGVCAVCAEHTFCPGNG